MGHFQPDLFVFSIFSLLELRKKTEKPLETYQVKKDGGGWRGAEIGQLCKNELKLYFFIRKKMRKIKYDVRKYSGIQDLVCRVCS